MLDLAADMSGARKKIDVDFLVDWAEREIGINLRAVPRLLDIFAYATQAMIDKRMLRLVVLGPRGGGKTKLAAAIELVAYRWFGYEASNLGGSLDQSKRCFEHVRDAHLRSEDLQKFTAELQATRIRSHKGDDILIFAASMRSVRGAHPVGSSGGGLMVLDEAALIEDSIVDASKGQMTAAKPSAIIQTSTMGERLSGRFWELVSDPKSKGYDLKRFDVFDVAKRCQYDCATTCPVKEHFAEDFYEGDGSGRHLVHAAYCGGRAHEVNGWIDVDEIAQNWRESSRNTFEREMLGRSTTVVGSVYDANLVDAAVLKGKSLARDADDHDRRFLALDKAVGIDWGFSSECAVAYMVRIRDSLVVYRWQFFTRERYGPVREDVLRWCFEERVESIYCDSSNPSDNEELSNRGNELAEARGLDWSPRVAPVVFSRWKDYGIGEVRRRLEKRQLFFAPDFGGRANLGHDKAMKSLKAYHTDKHGNPVKVDDHACDALLCGVIGFAPSFRAMLDPVGIRR